MRIWNNIPPQELDRLRTYKEAASLLGVPYFKIQRAALQGLIPTYAIFNSRRYVTLRDIIACLSHTA